MNTLKEKIKIVLYLAGIFCLGLTNYSSAATPTWNQFVDAKNNGTTLPFPDFSYVGYEQGAKSIPNPSWQQFDVTDYGATPNDNSDDLDGIKAAIAEAQKADGAIVYFPKGRYLISERTKVYNSLINITGSKLILRGEGSGAGGTELFFREHLWSRTPEKKWTTPPMIAISGSTSSSSGSKITGITGNAKTGDFHITVADSKKLKVGDNIIINLHDSKAANNETLKPYNVENNWSRFKTGEFSREFHQIQSINGNTITLKMPLAMDIDKKYNWELRRLTLGKNVGIEKIAFVGNWKGNFKHHKDIIHDSAWTGILINKYENSWVKDVRFKDWNQTMRLHSNHSFSIINSLEEGNRGHQSILVENSYGVLVTHSHDRVDRGMHHAFGVASWAAATVFHRSSWPKETSFDAHASFPHATLFDRVDGGFSGASGGHGGSDQAQPNHMRNLIFWNFKDLGANDGVTKDWWRTDSKYGRFLQPKIIGWHGARANFIDSQLSLNESYGNRANPESLYEAQLKLRLGKLPDWLVKLNGGTSGPSEPPQNPDQIAFKSHNIPGKVQAEDYDKGGQGIAYNDSNTINSGNKNYREGAIDLENTSDNGGGLNVGWIKNGEWMEYTIQNIDGGQYDIKVRHASKANSSGKSLGLKIDNQNLGNANITNTGAWQNWKTTTISNVTITKGQNRVLRLTANGSDFNINWVEFVKKTSTQPKLITSYSVVNVTNQEPTNPATNLYSNNTSGTVGTRWSGKGLNQSPLTVVLDMQNVYRITQTELFPYQERDYRFTFAVSNNPNSGFTTVVDRSQNTNGGLSLKDTTSITAVGRYLRLTISGANTYKGDWSSINEIKVIGIKQ